MKTYVVWSAFAFAEAPFLPTRPGFWIVRLMFATFFIIEEMRPLYVWDILPTLSIGNPYLSTIMTPLTPSTAAISLTMAVNRSSIYYDYSFYLIYYL